MQQPSLSHHPYHSSSPAPSPSPQQQLLINTSSSFSQQSTESEQRWRMPGRQFRERLLQRDGSCNSIRLDVSGSLEQYYGVANRVLEQFLEHAVDSRDELIEAYLIGSRLRHFLAKVLPTHPHYHNVQYSLLRNKSQSQLDDLLMYLEQVAQLLDREQHNLYVQSVLLEHDEQRQHAAETECDDETKTEQWLVRVEEEKDASVSSLVSHASSSASRASRRLLHTSYQSHGSQLPLLRNEAAIKHQYGGRSAAAYDTKTLLYSQQQIADEEDDDEEEGSVDCHAQNDSSLNSSNPFDGVMLSPISRHEESRHVANDGGCNLELAFHEDSDEQGFEQVLDEEERYKSRENSPTPAVSVRVHDAIKKFEQFSSLGKTSESSRRHAQQALDQVRERRRDASVATTTGSSHHVEEENTAATSSSGRVTPLTRLVDGSRARANHYPVRYGHWERPTSPWMDRPLPRERVETKGTLSRSHRRDRSDHLESDESMEGRRQESAGVRSNSPFSVSSVNKLHQVAASTSNESHTERRLAAARSIEMFESSFLASAGESVPMEPRLGAEPRLSPWKEDLDLARKHVAEDAAMLNGEDTGPSRPNVSANTKESASLVINDPIQLQAIQSGDPDATKLGHGEDDFAERLALRKARVEDWKQRRMANETLNIHRTASVGRGESVRHLSRHEPVSPELLRSRRRSYSPPGSASRVQRSRLSLQKADPTMSSDFVAFDTNTFANESAVVDKGFSVDAWEAAWPDTKTFSDPPIQLDMSTSSIDSNHRVIKSTPVSLRRARSDTTPSKSPNDCGSSEWQRQWSVTKDNSVTGSSAEIFDPFHIAQGDDDAASNAEIVASRKAFDQKLETMRKQQQLVTERGRNQLQSRNLLESSRIYHSRSASSRQSSPTSAAPFDSTLNTWSTPEQSSIDLHPTLIEKRLNEATKTSKASPTAVSDATAFADESLRKANTTTAPRRLYRHQAMTCSDRSLADDEYDLIHGGVVDESSQSIVSKGQRRIRLLRGCVSSFLRD
ncbi:hypothetical protein MPSEU_000871400 [Mayamaea pseudoterrestris]|nr:hypothetical protein MPSEU_000871400 [Mayamaea pseudoterrestris]